ncbi:hypothetical protein AXG93_1217s1250 [Marchantia polymorpha subsp. ruderalis]|uniref:Ribosomal RNA-processing protein 43 n=1 Tax=Marchantia polymorpha subsp. ruderalis TaxID=1480154 RepID=A0A176VU17_MARPO|nr:hypothetical protein AXG93_1217s1250 [Marchantia polymorpha subsp. ruderalis]
MFWVNIRTLVTDMRSVSASPVFNGPFLLVISSFGGHGADQYVDHIITQDIYCLNADGSLFDAALLACAAALTDLQIPGVAIDDDGKVQIVSPSGDQDQHMLDAEKVSDESKSRRIDKRRLTLGPVPVALTCMLHKKHILADPTAEEETYLQTTVTVAMDSSDKLISLYKPGGLIVATTSTIMDCIALTRIRLKEVNRILIEAAQVKAGD